MNTKTLRAAFAATVMAAAIALGSVAVPATAHAATGQSIVDIAVREFNDSTRNHEVGNNCSYYGGNVFGWPACGGLAGWGGGGDGYAWCAAFAKYAWREGGVTVDLRRITGMAYSFKNYGQEHGTWHPRGSYVPQPGDAVVFDWLSTPGAGIDHVGIVQSVSGTTLNTIEGNTDDLVKARTRGNYATNVEIVGYTTPVGLVNSVPQVMAGRLADFDGNGKKDVAAFNASGDGLWIHNNTSTSGSPSIGTGQSVSTGWSSVDNAMGADFDGDGKDDIVGRYGDTLAVWRSNSSSGTFTPFTYTALGTGFDNYSKLLPLGDFNGDGKKDVAALDLSSDGLWVHRNTSTSGSPSLAAGQKVGVDWGTVNSMMAVDFDGDGKDDIVGRFGDNLAVWRSTSTGTTFSFAYTSLGTGWDNYSQLLPVGDFNGDGKKDIAALNASGDGLWIHRNTSTSGSPSLAAGQSITAGWGVVDTMMTGDYDGDGKDDIIGRYNGTLAVWRSTSSGTTFSAFAYTGLGTGWNNYSEFVTAAPTA
ncbi:FG-GAP-like repeat-containing protein [Catellatospora sp. KI3]|uniref:FG-GAP-like repeat-containing protein n=1 Tax=Catellatospora sp. KI3 TaxID=3041620 RepID=UPI0024827C13|nr:FG-GAP-like repeat-containing protein [Catellatospora sp. KI3]MDI1463250.1 FG-GAP-like repeat-containing protein [Catellatospora sp. KI3]